MDNKLKIFTNGLKVFDELENEIIDIIKKYTIDYYKNTKPRIKYYNRYLGNVDITITFNTGRLPYALIRDLDSLIGLECDHISCSAGHDMTLHYTIKK